MKSSRDAERKRSARAGREKSALRLPKKVTTRSGRGLSGRADNRRGGGRGRTRRSSFKTRAPEILVEVADLHGAAVVAPAVVASNPAAADRAADVVAGTAGRVGRAADDAGRDAETDAGPQPKPFLPHACASLEVATEPTASVRAATATAANLVILVMVQSFPFPRGACAPFMPIGRARSEEGFIESKVESASRGFVIVSSVTGTPRADSQVATRVWLSVWRFALRPLLSRAPRLPLATSLGRRAWVLSMPRKKYDPPGRGLSRRVDSTGAGVEGGRTRRSSCKILPRFSWRGHWASDAY